MQVLHIELSDDQSSDVVILKERWKAATKLLHSVRNLACDHTEVHLLSTLESISTIKAG
jgi:hypothetical protein